MSAEDMALGLTFGLIVIAVASIVRAVRKSIRKQQARAGITEWNELMRRYRTSQPGKTNAVEINITSGHVYDDWCNKCIRTHDHIRLYGYVDDRPHEPVFHAIRPLCDEDGE